MNLSIEQLDIIKSILNNNIIVEAVAGSGKTSTALEMAKAYPNLNFLLIVYNLDLKDDTQKKVDEQNIKNINIDNYHSLIKKFYDEDDINDDFGINKVIKNDPKLTTTFIPDVIIIDEVQDMTALYYKLIKKFLKDLNNKDISLCVFGDRKQTLYRHAGADYRFLELADKIFNNLNKEWIKLKLTNSFRVPSPICSFLNKAYYKTNFIVPFNKGNEKVDYIIHKSFDVNTIVNHIIKEIDKYGLENTFLLVNSTKVKNPKNPLNLLFNKLSNHFPLYIKDDVTRGDKSLKENKLEITTMNSTKGREKDLVIVYGFDDYWFNLSKDYKDYEASRDKFYVAITRARKKVVLLQSTDNKTPPFIDKKALLENCNIIGDVNKITMETKHIKPKKWMLDVKSVSNYVDSLILFDFFNNLTIEEFEYKNQDDINFMDTVFDVIVDHKGRNIKENVEVINNSLITYLKLLQKPNFINKVKKQLETYIELISSDEDYDKFKSQKNYIDKLLNKNNFDIRDLTEIVCLLQAITSGRLFQYDQLKKSKFEWLTEDFYVNVKKLFNDIDPSNKLNYKELIYINHDKCPTIKRLKNTYLTTDIIISGTYDCYDEENKTLWQFYIKNNLTKEAYFETIMYAYMLYINNKEIKNIFLFNLYDLKICRLKIDFNFFKEVLYKILSFKVCVSTSTSDDEFLKSINN